jgi:hypothetical protein
MLDEGKTEVFNECILSQVTRSSIKMAHRFQKIMFAKIQVNLILWSKFTKLLKKNSKDFRTFERHLRTKYTLKIDILLFLL